MVNDTEVSQHGGSQAKFEKSKNTIDDEGAPPKYRKAPDSSLWIPFRSSVKHPTVVKKILALEDRQAWP